jgi:hypothetical protein
MAPSLAAVAAVRETPHPTTQKIFIRALAVAFDACWSLVVM